MGYNYRFDIVQVFTIPVESVTGTEELVTGIDFSYIGSKEDQNTFIIDNVDIPYDLGVITPYNELPKEQMIKWIEIFIDEDKLKSMQSMINTKLEEMIAHYAQFKRIDNNQVPKPSLFPWASLEKPEGAIEIKPKIDTGSN